MEFWSFNGAKFDHILIIPYLIKKSNDMEIFGTNTDLKMVRYKTCYFYDMMLIYKGSLMSVAKDLGCEVVEKLPLDVAHKDEEWYEEHK